MIDDLKDIAIRFQIDPKLTVGHAAKISTVVSVLDKINTSFHNFIEIEFFKNDEFKDISMENRDVFNNIKNELELLVVDLKFSSFEAALAPNIISNQTSLFSDNIKNWKTDVFNSYKENILIANYNEDSYIKNIQKRYSEAERQKIYSPLFAIAEGGKKGYTLNLKNSKGAVIKEYTKPNKQNTQLIIPKKINIENKEESKTYQVFVKVKTEQEGFQLKKANIKELLYFEELEHETYPFKQDIIKHNGVIYSLNSKIECKVEFIEDTYVITNDLLEITSWGETREEAEQAFAFSFDSLYKNFAIEKDEKLSSDAKILKRDLLTLVKAVLNEK
ncbi:hypothetical protein VB776_18545 [Arcicella sp. DC2W]|uniref:CYTH domain-containing protein n=1 Tax=Arcicella gelida TaxID=2984195 RepID=A0ABU5S952_9BACT|nr:hypothetical protein [Arcicella sp. DC2W]MEA5404940.1 hypothetical protein [Arcicella sp. DC2W]